MASNTTPTKVATYQVLNGALTRLKSKLNPTVSAHQNIGNIAITLDNKTGTVELLGYTVDITGSQLNNSITALIYDTDGHSLRRECNGMVIAKMEDACLVAFSLAENPHGVDGVLLAKLDLAGEHKLFMVKPGSSVTSDDLAPLTSDIANITKRIDGIIGRGMKEELSAAFVYNKTTGKVWFDEQIGDWSDITVYNKVAIYLMDDETGDWANETSGIVLSNNSDSLVLAFSLPKPVG